MYVWDRGRLNQDNKKKSGRNIFSHFEEKWFSQFQKNQNFENKIWQSIFRKMEILKCSIFSKFSCFSKNRFSIFFLQNFHFWNFWFFWNFENHFSPKWENIFRPDFFNCLGLFVLYPKHTFRAPTMLSGRCYTA